MNKLFNNSCVIALLCLSASCASNYEQKFSPKKSYLANSEQKTVVDNAVLVDKKNTELENAQQFRFVPPLKTDSIESISSDDLLNKFDDKKSITFAADELALKDLLHLVFGERLNLSYVLGDDIKNDAQTVTLNLQSDITEKKLFLLTEELLTQRNYIIRVDDDIFYVHKSEGKGSNADVVYGYGKKNGDVPQTSQDIVQMIPFEYGLQVSLANTLRQLIGIRATTDIERQSLTIRGKRKDIIRALEFIRLMDSPTMKNRQVGVYTSVFTSTELLSEKLEELLAQEGVSVAADGNTEKALSIVQIDKQGKIVLFANNQRIIERAIFWAKEIDKPLATNQKQYFIYHPSFARAIDLGSSLANLIGDKQHSGQSGQASNTTSAASEIAVI